MSEMFNFILEYHAERMFSAEKKCDIQTLILYEDAYRDPYSGGINQ